MLDTKLITAKEAEAWIPLFDQIVGNVRLRQHLEERVSSGPLNSEPNLVVIGPPGSGKSATQLCHVQRRMGNTGVGWEDENCGLFQADGNQYGFVRIDGATVSEARLRSLVSTAMHGLYFHNIVFLDEVGELYFRRLDEIVRPMLDHPNVTTFATAQNFHSKRRTDTDAESDDRQRALLRRFRFRISTDLPTEGELYAFLIRRMSEWGVSCPDPNAIRLLVRKSDCNVGFALGAIVQAIASPARMLTFQLVSEYAADPMSY